MRQASLFPRLALIIVALFGAVVGSRGFSSAAESARSVPPPVLNEPADVRATSEVAILAGGCFWGVQGVFQHVEGVTSAVSGYAGGAADTAHYEMVSSNTTGHAESVRVTFDPHRISYGRILQIYFSVAMIRPSSTARDRMSEPSTARQSSQPIPSRRALPRPISPS